MKLVNFKGKTVLFDKNGNLNLDWLQRSGFLKQVHIRYYNKNFDAFLAKYGNGHCHVHFTSRGVRFKHISTTTIGLEEFDLEFTEVQTKEMEYFYLVEPWEYQRQGNIAAGDAGTLEQDVDMTEQDIGAPEAAITQRSVALQGPTTAESRIGVQQPSRTQ